MSRGRSHPPARARGLFAAAILVLAGISVARAEAAGVPVVTPAAESAAPGATASDHAHVPATGDTVRLVDDLGRELRFDAPPDRIISLIPAVTELLFALGAADRLVGRTRYGVHPAAARRVPSVGEGVRPSIERILDRDPEVVVLFAGPDNRSALRELERVGIPTLALSHNDLEDLFRNLRRLGTLTGRREAARRLVRRLRCQLAEIGRITAAAEPRRIYYEVWADPPMTVGRGSYLDSLISLAGGENIFADLEAPSPSVSLEAIASREPEMIIVPGRTGEEGRPPPPERPGWESLEAVRAGAVRPVDGDLVHRLGPRLGEAAATLAAAIHPRLSNDLGAIGRRESVCPGS